MSYIALLPGSLSNIQHNIQILTKMKQREKTNAENAIEFDTEFDTIVQNRKIITNGNIASTILTGYILGYPNR